MPNQNLLNELASMEQQISALVYSRGQWFPMEDDENNKNKIIGFQVGEKVVGFVEYKESCIHHPFYWCMQYMDREFRGEEMPQGYTPTLANARRIVETIYAYSHSPQEPKRPTNPPIPPTTHQRKTTTQMLNSEIERLINNYSPNANWYINRLQQIQVSPLVYEFRYPVSEIDNRIIVRRYTRTSEFKLWFLTSELIRHHWELIPTYTINTPIDTQTTIVIGIPNSVELNSNTVSDELVDEFFVSNVEEE